MVLATSISFYFRCVDVHTHTHTRLTALCLGLPRWTGTRKSTTPASYLQPLITSNIFGKQSTSSYTANPPHRIPSPLLALHLQTALLPFSPAKYPNSVSLSPATLLHHLILPLALTSQFSLMPQNPKSVARLHARSRLPGPRTRRRRCNIHTVHSLQCRCTPTESDK